MARYANDPRYIIAKYAGVDADGHPFAKGARVLYYPADRTFVQGEKAEQAWRDFQAAAFDESAYSGSW